MVNTPPQRDDAVRRASALGEVDVLIVGAGVNGAGTFRDLCLNGITCLLVDAEDFGAGATGASTRIAHGGLRYLENGEFRLVAEATRERNRLLRTAPHYVAPLLITIPSFSHLGGLTPAFGKLFGLQRPMRSRGLVLIRIGLTIYDWLGRSERALPRHKMTGGRGVRRLLPRLHPALSGIASYYDARISHPERLVFELVADGLAANPASVAINHCRVQGAAGDSVSIRDEETEAVFGIRPKLVVNAAGAWIDGVNTALGSSARLIAGTKGSHIMIDNPELRDALGGRCFSYDDGSGRMCVAYAIGRLVLLGSSDIRVDDPRQAVCDEAEVAYFLASIRLIFPTIAVDHTQIRYRFCGVRPLPVADVKDTVNISRDHSIRRLDPQPGRPFPVLCLIGGKWTTFRAFAEQAADRVLSELGIPRRQSTRTLAIGGGRGFPLRDEDRKRWIADASADTDIADERMETLLVRYGTTARSIAAFCAEVPDAPLRAAPEYSIREMLYLIRFEMVRTLEDLIYRRTTLALNGRLTFDLMIEIAGIIVEERAPTNDRMATIAEVLRLPVLRLRRENGIDFGLDLQHLAGAAASPAAVA
ncbi:glycerol-3-phosphate dehydrogenase/oxidase [Lichenicoccus sp.]|uniref:glycerol-3-phosphate dehydrogenase/oxidase n=1 Tax=Lichenicoccus sp. TaxID=2781899 RepID=UPI003D102249